MSAKAPLPGVLASPLHDRLYAESAELARRAGIPRSLIWTPLAESGCGKAEREWVEQYPRHAREGRSGFAYHGTAFAASPLARMQAMAGCLVRNFVDARVRTVAQVLADLRADEPPRCSCLLVPDFFVPKQDGGGLAKWQVQALHGLLLERRLAEQQTVVWVRDTGLMAVEYGAALAEHLDAHFVNLEA